jgi:hypothetical protein
MAARFLLIFMEFVNLTAAKFVNLTAAKFHQLKLQICTFVFG